MSEYSYDEQGDVWPYFLIAILSVILIPLTINYVYNVLNYQQSIIKINSKVEGSIVENNDSLDLPTVKKTTRSRIFNKTLIVIIIGWASVIYVLINLTKSADMSSIFDPYEILGISSSSTEKQIKSHYRKLSLIYHPDKIPKNLSEGEREKMEQDFVRLNKAYKALTDEVTRENFLKFGHPDGKQEVTNGIALPKFLVEGKSSLIMIGFYIVLIGVLLPFIVGSWWNNVKSYTSHGLHVKSADLFTKFFTDRNPGKVITPKFLLSIFFKTFEIQKLNISESEYNKILESYTSRDFSNAHSKTFDVVSSLPDLIDKFNEIAIFFRQYDVILVSLELKKSIIQAVKFTGKHHDILQLPYVDRATVESQPIKRLGKLFTLKNEELKKVLGIKDDAKLKKCMEIAEKICSLRIVSSEFQVPGEDIVPPTAKSHINLKFLVKSPKLKSCPDLKDEEIKDDFNENIEYLKDPSVVNKSAPLLPISYSPFFPDDLRNSWTGILINQKDNKIVEGSTIINLTNVDLSNVSLTQEEWIKGKVYDEKTKQGVLKLNNFNIPVTQPTPAGPGSYPFRLILKNNAYFGVDLDIPLYMEVKNPPPVPLNKDKILGKNVDDDDDSDSDISDPDEDTLAGALSALRGGKVKKIEEIKDDEEEEEDDEDEDVFTDINTDTEDEDE